MVIRFCAVISNAADYLNHAMWCMQTSEQKLSESLQGKLLATTPKEHIGQIFHFGKVGTGPQESVDGFKALLPLAALQFINHELSFFVEAFQGDESANRQELEFGEGDDEATCLNSKERLHTIAFKYLGNGHIYIALNSQAIYKFVCSWVQISA